MLNLSVDRGMQVSSSRSAKFPHLTLLYHRLRSAHPTSGGPYFWAAMLSNDQDAPLASWVTGQ
jgi:hypothetical protein